MLGIGIRFALSLRAAAFRRPRKVFEVKKGLLRLRRKGAREIHCSNTLLRPGIRANFLDIVVVMGL